MTAYAPTRGQAEAAAHCVIRHAGDDETARELLDMLGLAAPDPPTPTADEPRADGTKTCTHCGGTKPLAEFYALKGSKDGRRAQCIACSKAKRTLPPREPAPCGTVAAHARHKRRGEPIDDACAEANRAHNRAYLRGWRANRKATR